MQKVMNKIFSSTSLLSNLLFLLFFSSLFLSFLFFSLLFFILLHESFSFCFSLSSLPFLFTLLFNPYCFFSHIFYFSYFSFLFIFVLLFIFLYTSVLKNYSLMFNFIILISFFSFFIRIYQTVGAPSAGTSTKDSTVNSRFRSLSPPVKAVKASRAVLDQVFR